MSARLLDGVAIAQAIRGEVRPDADAFTREAGRQPGLALVLVGNDPASELYVGSKLKSAGESGIRADLERLPATANVDGSGWSTTAPNAAMTAIVRST